MPTDTTIIDRLREIGDRLANAAWAQTCHDAADALTAAHAARDAAQTNLRAVMKRADADLAAALRERDEARAAINASDA